MTWLRLLLGLHVHSFGIWHHDKHGELVKDVLRVREGEASEDEVSSMSKDQA